MTTSFYWDTTCVHGFATLYGFWRSPLSGLPNTTQFVMPIGQAATFDPIGVAQRIAKATADEARAVSEIHYHSASSSSSSNGTDIWGLICNGGPLANLVHDPHWGRISETYGEDPLLISLFSSHFVLGLQQNVVSPFLNDELGYIKTASVLRHFLPYR
jgi:beta-glucosidase-like glycosyl hydrolase